MNFTISEVPKWYQNYVTEAGDGDIVDVLNHGCDSLIELLGSLTDDQALYRYAPEKWSIKDLIQHLTDSERVFIYRALRFARNDKTELSGFEQDDYVPEANADQRPLKSLLDEFANVRRSTSDFYRTLSEKELSRTGVSNGVEMSVEMLGYIIAGHTMHHINVLKERYLK